MQSVAYNLHQYKSYLKLFHTTVEPLLQTTQKKDQIFKLDVSH